MRRKVLELTGMMWIYIIKLKFINFNLLYFRMDNLKALRSGPTLSLIKVNFKIKKLCKLQLYYILLLPPRMNGDRDKVLAVGKLGGKKEG